MWNSFLHLTWRSLVYFPVSLSSNWLSISLPAIIWAMREGLRVRKSGWGAMNWKTIGVDTWLMVGAYAALFLWAVIHTVYSDHILLRAQNQLLQSELTQRNNKGLSLQIGGFVSTGINHDSTRLQLTVAANNDGVPTTARDWELTVHTSNGNLTSYHAFGDQLAKDSLDLPRLDSRLQEPIETGTEIPGLVSFVFLHIPHERIDNLRNDKDATLYLSVHDRFGKIVSTERNIAEMAGERFDRRRSR
jgi:hypothetical protein